MTKARSNAVAAAAKGDLTIGTGTNSSGILAVSASAGEVLTVDSSTTTGLKWAAPASTPIPSNIAGKNGVINGGFDIWQRSTSATFAGTVIYPAADRFFAISTTATCTMSRQTADTTGLTYGLRFGRNSGQTATGDVWVGYILESIDAKRFAGQTVTLSFYVKKGADAPTSLVSTVQVGTGTDQGSAALFSTGWTGGSSTGFGNTTTTTMTRYEHTLTLGSTVNEIALLFNYVPSGTAGVDEWFQIEGLQFEVASAASSFSRNTGSVAEELSAAQRYYLRVGNGGSTNGRMGVGYASTYNTLIMNIFLPKQMRISPTAIDTSAMNTFMWEGGNYGNTPTSITLSTAYTTPTFAVVSVNKTGAFDFQTSMDNLQSNNTTAYIGFNAEL